MYTKGDLEEFFDSYVEAALWSSNDESTPAGGEPLDRNYTADDLTQRTEDEMVADCKQFLDKAWRLIEAAPAQIANYPRMEMAGFDFWLSRNGHGISFTDDWPHIEFDGAPIAEQLDEIAESFGSYNLFVDRGGKIHGSEG